MQCDNCRRVVEILLLLTGILLIKGDTDLEHVKAVWSRYAQLSNGVSSYRSEYQPGTGACAIDPLAPLNSEPGWVVVAAGKEEYLKSLGCGMCVEIMVSGQAVSTAHGSEPPMNGSLKATIVDLCGGCQQGGFNLYVPGYGTWKTSFKSIECPKLAGQDGKIQFRFFASNPWSIKLQVRNSKVVTAGLEILHNNRWICMRRTDDNYFTISGIGELKFPIKVRVTSIANERLESTITRLVNDVSIPTTIQYKGFIEDSIPEKIKCYGQGDENASLKRTKTEITSPNSTFNHASRVSPYTTSNPTTDTPIPHNTATPTLNQMLPTNTPSPLVQNGSHHFIYYHGEDQLSNGEKSTSQDNSIIITQDRTSLNNTSSSAPDKSPILTDMKDFAQTFPTEGTPKYSNKDGMFCERNGDGIYAEKENCYGFVLCGGGIAHKKTCPPGLIFNTDLMVCDWSHEVKCNPDNDVIGR
ncbi:uncharacterized protein LOC5500460 isoform X1 [Nematostella vectensis]|uniref:uncharacterized protein LOC5500460 isoform X1 n=1 Tax=Nematostella vectensis TaxID=45351 RepID=UPI0020775D91|nr:uncharacterized protein LOC5500460 isoform X1 [Nematostella vectensis]